MFDKFIHYWIASIVLASVLLWNFRLRYVTEITNFQFHRNNTLLAIGNGGDIGTVIEENVKHVEQHPRTNRHPPFIPEAIIGHAIDQPHLMTSGDLTPSYKACANALMLEQSITQISEIELPSFNEDIKIPFYIFPFHLPDEEEKYTSKWSDCIHEYIVETKNQGKLNPNEMHFYYAALQLEKHPWRVYKPEDAFIYVSSRLNVNKTIKLHRLDHSCQNMLHSNHGNDELLNNFIESHPNIQRESVISLYQGSEVFQDTEASKIPTCISKECSFEANKTSCFLHEELLEEENIRSYDEWLNGRPFSWANMTLIDSSADSLPERAFISALHKVMQQKGDVNLNRVGPFIQLDTYRPDKPDFNADEIISSPSGLDLKVLSDNYNDTLNHSDDIAMSYLPSLLWLRIKLARNHLENRQISDVVARASVRSKFSLSKRKNSPIDSNILAGFHNGNVAHHDQTENEFLEKALLPDALPWRLFGIWDNEKCLSKLYNRMKSEFPNQSILFFDQTDNFREDAYQSWAREYFDCFQPLIDLFDVQNAEYLDLMRKAINKYRQDVLWEVPGSRVGQNLIINKARDVLKSSQVENDPHLNIAVPKECLLNGGPESH